MSTYVMSDIHGCYNGLCKMLNTINFCDKDQLIIAGDYIDRGSQNAEILSWIKHTTENDYNILLLKGNHDVEFSYNIQLMIDIMKTNKIKIDTTNNKATELIYELSLQTLENNKYFDYYGTIKNLIFDNFISLEKLIEYKNIIDSMPYLFKTNINNKNYIIVHAGYIEDKEIASTSFKSVEDFYLYARDEAYTYGGKNGYTVIAGHTPTISKNSLVFNNGYIYRYFNKKNNCEIIDIDCGYAYNHNNSHLSCIRLDDMKIYYI